MDEVAIGDVLAGKYRVERVLGRGGMGVVVAALHIALDERVAIKLMRPEALVREDGVARFLREARAAVRLKSEHVARVLDVATLESGAPYIVMEYLEGEDLAHRLGSGRIAVDEAVDFVLQACDAIAEAHERGVIHRDLKPANLFITRGRRGEPLVKVLDFGISKVSAFGDRVESVTNSAVLLGSPVYMSPEQMRSSRDVDRTTDIWSLGIILYEALGGRVPFDEQTIGALMARVLTEPTPDLSALSADLPQGLVQVVHRCLEKTPSLRYPSVVALAEALAPFGPAASSARVARISTMASVAASLPPAAPSVPASLPRLPEPGHANTVGLGVAATQAAPATLPNPVTAVSSRRSARPYVAVAVALAAAFGVGVLARRTPAGEATTAHLHAPAPSLKQPELAPSVDPSGPQTALSVSSVISVSSASTSPSAPPASPRVGASSRPSAAPSARPGAPPPQPSASGTASPSVDPFGSSRL